MLSGQHLSPGSDCAEVFKTSSISILPLKWNRAIDLVSFINRVRRQETYKIVNNMNNKGG